MIKTFKNGYALLIGVGESAYDHSMSLPATVKDVQAINEVLRDPNLCAYSDDNIRLLYNETATRSNILLSLRWLQEKAQSDPEATILIYYSGHGCYEKPDQYYLIPHDCDSSDMVNSALTAIKLNSEIHKIAAQRLLVIIDSCHAGGMASSKLLSDKVKFPSSLSLQPIPKGIIQQLKQGKGRVIFASSQENESSWIMKDNSMSVYTHHLLEALQGSNNHLGETTVTVSNLMNHLSRQVPVTAQQVGGIQTPYFDFNTEDFPIALVRGGKGLPQAGWQSPLTSPEVPSSVTTTVVGDNNITGGVTVSGNGNIVGNGNTVR